jgi:heparosan-N-sulfate-glucuronate 5-epimerase
MKRPLIPLAVKAARDLRMHRYPVHLGIRPDGHGPYPLDLSSVRFPFRLGADGLVTVPGPDGQAYCNPVSACLYALARHTEAALGRPAHHPGLAMRRFLTQARFLRESQDPAGGWQYPVPVPRYQVAPGWYSAMAQGLAMSVLLRAHDATGEPVYREAAEGAVALLLKPLESGGCAHYDMLGRPFLEECPTDPPCHILNGALFALIGLGEWEARAGGGASRRTADRLVAQLAEYDTGYWSRYDLRFIAPATMAYHSLHVSLLEANAQLLGYEVFGRTARRWRGYMRHPRNRIRAAAAKAQSVMHGHD